MDPISNYFNALLDGVGHRGSSFTDVDALTHDEATDRYLVQEFKGPGEELNKGQKRYLIGLARKDFITVWCVRKRADGYLDWYDVANSDGVVEVITEEEYRDRFRRWWNRETIKRQQPRLDPPPSRRDVETMTADEINWGSSPGEQPNKKKDDAA